MATVKITLEVVQGSGAVNRIMDKREHTFMGAAQYVMDATKFYMRAFEFDVEFEEETRYVNILVEYGSGIHSDIYIQRDAETGKVTIDEV